MQRTPTESDIDRADHLRAVEKGNPATELHCAHCGELSTNPGQFLPDGRWVCTQACKNELPADCEPWEEEMRRDIKRREIQSRVPKAGPPHDRHCAGCERCFRRPTRLVRSRFTIKGKPIGEACYEVPDDAPEPQIVVFSDLTQEQRYRIRQIAEESLDD